MESVKVEKIVYDDMLYTVSEVATLLKTNSNAVYSLIRNGKLKALKLGSIKVRKRSLENFLNEYDGLDITNPNNITEIDFNNVSRGKARSK